MTGRRESVTVVIPTLNAAHLLGDCLESVKWADEIVVVDMNSTDGTDELCARYPQCRVLKREDFIFGNMNFGFEQATSDWIIRLDSDERITPELRGEMEAFLAAPPDGVIGLACWERCIILGHELRYGFGRRHHRKLLFRKGSARYLVRSEHEDLTSDGEWRESTHGYLHYNIASVADYMRKTDYYTTRDVDRMDLPAEPPSPLIGLRDAARAFYLYYLRWRGYHDGWIGFMDAGMRAMYQFVQWSKIRERWAREHAR